MTQLLQPGLGLDELIARRVFGWDWLDDAILNRFRQVVDCRVEVHHNEPWGWTRIKRHIGKQLPFYSTDIDAAWSVVEALGLHVGPYSLSSEGEITSWFAANKHDWNDEQIAIEVSTTAPHAICLVALKMCEGLPNSP